MSEAPVKILVVDDSRIMRRIITSLLMKMGYPDVVEVSNGTHALNILKTGAVTVVISDYSMPGMSGLELLGAIRRDPQSDGIPFIMITAEAQLGQIIAAFREGAQYYVTKPFSSEYMEYIINETLARK